MVLYAGGLPRRTLLSSSRRIRYSDLTSGDFRKHQAAEERNQVAVCTRVLSARIGGAPLSLRDDVELTQIQLRGFAEQLAAFQITVAKFTSELQIPISANSFAFERLSSFVVVRRFFPPR